LLLGLTLGPRRTSPAKYRGRTNENLGQPATGLACVDDTEGEGATTPVWMAARRQLAPGPRAVPARASGQGSSRPRACRRPGRGCGVVHLRPSRLISSNSLGTHCKLLSFVHSRGSARKSEEHTAPPRPWAPTIGSEPPHRYRAVVTWSFLEWRSTPRVTPAFGLTPAQQIVGQTYEAPPCPGLRRPFPRPGPSLTSHPSPTTRVDCSDEHNDRPLRSSRFPPRPFTAAGESGDNERHCSRRPEDDDCLPPRLLHPGLHSELAASATFT
jgi:hypothetical protein